MKSAGDGDMAMKVDEDGGMKEDDDDDDIQLL